MNICRESQTGSPLTTEVDNWVLHYGETYVPRLFSASASTKLNPHEPNATRTVFSESYTTCFDDSEISKIVQGGPNMSALLTKDNVCILSNIQYLDQAFKSDSIAPANSKDQWYKMPMPIKDVVVAYEQFLTLSCDGQVH